MATDIVFQRNHKLGTLWSLFLAWVAESEGEQEWSKRFLNEVRKRWEGAKLTKLGESLILQAAGEDWQGKMAVFLLGELGQVEGAVEVAGLVLDDESKRKLTKIWASKRLFDQALKVAEGIEEWTGERARALAAIAVGMAEAGMFDRALKVAEGIEDAWWRAEVLAAIAEGMAKAGMIDWAKEVFEQALKVAEGIEEAWRRAWALEAIAEGMAKAGMTDWAKEVFEQALKVTEGIEEAWRRAEALREIAGEMAKAGRFDRALKVAEGIEDAWERAEALRAIAEGMAKAGMTDWAKEVFERALKVAEGIEEAWRRAWALREIAREMAKAGEVEGAVSIVEREMAVRTEGLPSVLQALAERAKQGDEKSKKEGFLKLLPWCGWSLEFAYKACGLLAWLYPERGGEIARVVSGE
jgi:tetratricopeptide (TPR) repeat protein